MDTTKYLFIHLKVQDGDRIHDHKILHSTKALNIQLAAERYVSRYWGFGKIDKATRWWDYGECSGKLVKVKELTKEQFDLLKPFIG